MSSVEKFDYLLSSHITVWGNHQNANYWALVQKNLQKIEEIWQNEQIEREAQKQKKLFNGKILNLVALRKATDHSIELLCHPIEYKHYLAQNRGLDLGITSLGVSGIVFYKQGGQDVFLIGKRSAEVTRYPGYYELMPSGSMDAAHFAPDSAMDYEKQLLQELQEELGISGSVKSKQSFCVVFDESDNVYDIGIEMEIEGSAKIQLQEYSSLERVTLAQLSEYMKKPNVVGTSRKLFEAWKAYRNVRE